MTNLYRVRTAIAGGPGGAEVTTMFFDGTSGTAQDAADAVRAWWLDLQSMIGSAYTMTVESAVYTINSTTGQATAATTTTTAPVTGTRSGEPLPAASQGLVRWHTGTFIGGRELTGRTFIPGASELDSDSGRPSTGYKNIVNSAANNLWSSGPITFGIYSRTNHLFAQATGGSTWAEWAVLRSRRS